MGIFHNYFSSEIWNARRSVFFLIHTPQWLAVWISYENTASPVYFNWIPLSKPRMWEWCDWAPILFKVVDVYWGSLIQNNCIFFFQGNSPIDADLSKRKIPFSQAKNSRSEFSSYASRPFQNNDARVIPVYCLFVIAAVVRNPVEEKRLYSYGALINRCCLPDSWGFDKICSIVLHSNPDCAPADTGHCKMQQKMAHIVFTQVCILLPGVSFGRSFFFNDSGKTTFIY